MVPEYLRDDNEYLNLVACDNDEWCCNKEQNCCDSDDLRFQLDGGIKDIIRQLPPSNSSTSSSTSIANSSPTCSSSSDRANGDDTEKDHSNTGLVAGLAVCAAAFVVTLVILLFMLRRQRNFKKTLITAQGQYVGLGKGDGMFHTPGYSTAHELADVGSHRELPG